MFIGEYSVELQDATLQLPWPLENVTGYLWVMFEDPIHDHVPLLRIAPDGKASDFVNKMNELMDEDIPVLHSGIAALMPGSRLELPPEFVGTLNDTHEVTLLGVMDLIEVWPKEAWQKARRELDATSHPLADLLDLF